MTAASEPRNPEFMIVENCKNKPTTGVTGSDPGNCKNAKTNPLVEGQAVLSVVAKLHNEAKLCRKSLQLFSARLRKRRNACNSSLVNRENKPTRTQGEEIAKLDRRCGQSFGPS
jgi:hypothetical protein